MHRSKLTLAALLVSASAQAALIFNNLGPTTLGALHIGLFRSADHFTLGTGQTVAGVQFFYSWTNPLVLEPADNFNGTITYAIYSDSAGSIASQITTGNVSPHGKLVQRNHHPWQQCENRRCANRSCFGGRIWRGHVLA